MSSKSECFDSEMGNVEVFIFVRDFTINTIVILIIKTTHKCSQRWSQSFTEESKASIHAIGEEICKQKVIMKTLEQKNISRIIICTYSLIVSKSIFKLHGSVNVQCYGGDLTT